MALTDTARAIVDRYSPDAPEGVRVDAAVLLLKVLQRDPGARDISLDGERVSYEVRAHQNAMRISGAAALLAPWRSVRAHRIGGES